MKLNKPEFDSKELKLVKEVFDLGLLTKGTKIAQFERMIADFAGIKYAVGVNSGTSALQLALKAIGIKPKDEIILPAFAHASVINPVLHLNAVPVLVDVNLNTLNIDYKLVEEKITPKTKAIIAVDSFGLSADYDNLREIAKKHSIKLVEDASAALGSQYKGVFCGTLADVSILSFHASRIITTGEGGMVLTNDEELSEKVRMLSNYGTRINEDYEIEYHEVGFANRMTEIQAVIGIGQMEKLERIRLKRNLLGQEYTKILYNIPFLSPAVEPADCFSVFQPYVIRLDTNIDRKSLIRILTEREIAAEIPASSLNTQKLYRIKGKYPVAEYAGKCTLALPLHSKLEDDYIYHVCDILSRFVR